MSTSTVAPETIRAGLTAKWTVDAGDYAPGGAYALIVDITSATYHVAVTATDNGDGLWLVTVTATVSAALPAGDYTCIAKATTGSGATAEAYQVAAWQMEVPPSLGAAVDSRSHVKKTLDAIEALIEGKATRNDVAQYSIGTGTGSRSLAYVPWPDLLPARNYYRRLYQQELADERRALGRPKRNRVVVRFGNPGA